jgi:hypothetical protein
LPADEVYDEACRHFSERKLVDLTAGVIAINASNRAAIAFRVTPPLKSEKIAVQSKSQSVPLVFGAPCQPRSLARQEHGRRDRPGHGV